MAHVCPHCEQPLACDYVSLLDEAVRICQHCSDAELRLLNRCPRCAKRALLRARSVRDQETSICAACREAEAAELSGTIAPWRGLVYWSRSKAA